MAPTTYDEWLGRTRATEPARRRGSSPGAGHPSTRRGAARRARAVRIAVVVVGLVTAVLALGGPAAATWSVVGTDPATGQVGAAVASCVDVHDLTTTMALVPGVGGAVSVGQSAGTTPTLLAAALRQERTSSAVVTAVRSPAVDTGAALREYGVAMLHGGAATATGADTVGTSGGELAGRGSAAVQGTVLASPAVLAATARAYDIARGPLASRLLAALDAGAAAGGDRGCGRQARAASLVVLGPHSAVFVPLAGTAAGAASDRRLLTSGLSPQQVAAALRAQAVLPTPTGPRAPLVYLSAVTGPGSNALATLDARYARMLAASRTSSTTTTATIVDPADAQWLTVAALILFCVVGLVIAALIIAGLRRAERHARSQREDGGAPRLRPYRGEVAHLFDVDLAAAARRRRGAAGRARDEGEQSSVRSGSTW